jgi:hypothetical protein
VDVPELLQKDKSVDNHEENLETIDVDSDETELLMVKQEQRDLNGTLEVKLSSSQLTVCASDASLSDAVESAAMPSSSDNKITQIAPEPCNVASVIVISDSRSITETESPEQELEDNNNESQAETSMSKKANYYVKMSELTNEQKERYAEFHEKCKKSDGSYACCGQKLSKNSIRNHIVMRHIMKNVSAKKMWTKRMIKHCQQVDLTTGKKSWQCVKCAGSTQGKTFVSLCKFKNHLKEHFDF